MPDRLPHLPLLLAASLGLSALSSALPAGAAEEPPPRLDRKTSPSGDKKYRDVQDSQGNRYKVDELGNIFTNGVPNPKRQPAAAENVNYYFNYAVDLMNKGYVAQGLEVYREILALPARDPVVVEAHRRARENYDGVRDFNLKNQSLDIQELVYVVRHIEDGRVIYDNERYRFRLRYPVNWRVEDEVRSHTPEIELREEESKWCLYIDSEGGQKVGCYPSAEEAETQERILKASPPEGSFATLTLHPLQLPAPDGGKVTIAIGFRAERVPDGLQLQGYRNQWVQRLEEADRSQEKLANLKRAPRPAGPDRLRDYFEVEMDSRRFAGDEWFARRGKFGYYLTFTATPETYEAAREIFDRFLSDFEVLP